MSPSWIGFHTNMKDVVCVSGLINWIGVSFNFYFKTKIKPTLVLYMLLTPNSQAMFPSELKRNTQILRKALYIWNGSWKDYKMEVESSFSNIYCFRYLIITKDYWGWKITWNKTRHDVNLRNWTTKGMPHNSA